MKKRKTIAVLEQFIDSNSKKRITYAYSFWGVGYGGILPCAIAVFRVYPKYKKPWIIRMFPRLEKKWWSKRLIASQVH